MSNASTDTVSLQSPEDYLAHGMRLVTTQTEAWWQHPAQHFLRNYLDRQEALAIIDAHQDEYAVIEESGPSGKRRILTPQRCGAQQADVVLRQQWYTWTALAQKLGYHVDWFKRNMIDPSALTERMRARGSGGAVKADAALVQAIEDCTAMRVRLSIRRQGEQVFPESVRLTEPRYRYADLATQLGTTYSRLQGLLADYDAIQVEKEGTKAYIVVTPALAQAIQDRWAVTVHLCSAGTEASKENAPAR